MGPHPATHSPTPLRMQINYLLSSASLLVDMKAKELKYKVETPPIT